jgi:hypothetical protein
LLNEVNLSSSLRNNEKEWTRLIATEAVSQLKRASAANTTSSKLTMKWTDRLSAHLHLELGSWLFNLLLAASTPGSLDGLLTVEVFNVLTDVLEPAKKLKKFKPTAAFSLVIPLLSRLLLHTSQFKQAPDLSRLAWLQKPMIDRYLAESEKFGKNASVSRALQMIINLLINRHQVDKSKSESKQQSDAKKPDDLFDLGPDLEGLSWFEKVAHTCSLMSDLVRSGVMGLPDWFLRASWCEYEQQKLAVRPESAHPYTSDVAWQEIHIPNASKLVIRIDGQSKTDPNDYLTFALPGAEKESKTKETKETKVISSSSSSSTSSSSTTSSSSSTTASTVTAGSSIGSFSGAMTASALLKSKGGQLIVEGSKVLWKFEQSTLPQHTQVYCSNCEFPIRGTRYSCVHCENNSYRKYNQANGYNLCEGCLQIVRDEDRHDKLHMFVALRRPIPFEVNVPKVVPAITVLYKKEEVRLMKAASSSSKTAVVHSNITCSICKTANITGCRYKCLACADYDVCASCETAGKHQSHDKSHIFLLIRHPITNPTGLNESLKPFVLQMNSYPDFWGYRFSVTPIFSQEHIQSLLKEHRTEIEQAVGLMKKYRESDSQNSLAIDQSVVELVNRAVDKRVKATDKEEENSNRSRYGNQFRSVSSPLSSPIPLRFLPPSSPPAFSSSSSFWKYVVRLLSFCVFQSSPHSGQG